MKEKEKGSARNVLLPNKARAYCSNCRKVVSWTVERYFTCDICGVKK